MTTNIDASIFIIILFNLERTSFFVIFFVFHKATICGNGRALWSPGDLRTCLRSPRRISYT